MNPTSIHEDTGLIPGLVQRVKDPVWLWCRLVAAGPIGPLAWELPYGSGAALKRQKDQKKKKKQNNKCGINTPILPLRAQS